MWIIDQPYIKLGLKPKRLNLVILNKILKFQAHLSAKFQWIFDDEEDEEDKPVVVDMAA